jgi:signal transduction histidine kinase
MNNIISNAAKFSPSTAKIQVDVSCDKDRVTIAVTDQGPGIAPDFRDKIFDKFTQSDSSDTRQTGGTGLGLSIAKFIMEKHGGDITFESIMGKGTIFYLHLPAHSENSDSDDVPLVSS